MANLPPMPETIKVATVLGAGTIGASWTALFLAAGLEVDVYDVADDTGDKVRAYVENAWPQLQALDLVTPNADRSRVRIFKTPEDAVARAQFVQESVPERIEIKHDLYRHIEPALQRDAIVSTSTSGILLKDLQAAWRDPGPLVIGHPFNPPHLIPLVELIANDRTRPGVLERAEQLYQSCGKVTIRINKEVPGHVANRLQAALWREAVHLVKEGVASAGDVDKAVSAGPGLRWAVFGPHTIFSLASGNQGLEVFCERFGPAISRWCETLGAPELDAEVGRLLASQIAEAYPGRSYADLASERDEKIIAILKATGRG